LYPGHPSLLFPLSPQREIEQEQKEIAKDLLPLLAEHLFNGLESTFDFLQAEYSYPSYRLWPTEIPCCSAVRQ